MKNGLKKLLTCLLVLTMVCGTVSTFAYNNVEIVEAASVKLNTTSKTLVKGKTYTLKVKNTKKKVTWSSNKKSVATVNSKGKVTAKKAGTATITAKVNGKKYTCKIKVENPSLSETKKTMAVSNTLTLSVKNNTQSVTWSSSDESIAKVNSSGKVTAKKAGSATIKAKVSGKTMSCKITVKSYDTVKSKDLYEDVTKEVTETDEEGNEVTSTVTEQQLKETVLTVKYNGSTVKDTYLFIKDNKVKGSYTSGAKVYKFDSDGYGREYTKTNVITSKYGINSTKYYVKNGTYATGWYTKDSKKYYYSKGTLVTNQIVGNKSDGYKYVDSTGIYVNTAEIKYAVQFVVDHSSSSKSNSDRLKQCYDYLWKNYTYKRFYNDTLKASNMPGFANYMFKNKKGNCYRYAACFAYIARVLGYDSRVATGKVSSAKGGMTPHGWTEVKKSGKWYMCDPDMQMNHPSKNSYMVTASKYKYKFSKSKQFTLTTKNGKVTWK